MQTYSIGDNSYELTKLLGLYIISNDAIYAIFSTNADLTIVAKISLVDGSVIKAVKTTFKS